jgi:hypothetical protein
MKHYDLMLMIGWHFATSLIYVKAMKKRQGAGEIHESRPPLA